MAKTVDNLSKMFSSCAESNVRYMAFAEAAEREGRPGVARIFRAIAAAKTFHALSHFRSAGLVDTTTENLSQAMEEELYDQKNAYPPMIQDAVNDDAVEGRHSLEYGMSMGPVITKFIGRATAGGGGDADGVYYVCPVCGNIEFGQPPAKCPFCGVDSGDFVEVC